MHKTIKIQAHCRDCFQGILKDENGKATHDYEGYVPDFFGSGADDVELEIDLATGQILNWTPPTKEDLEEFDPIKQ